MWFSGSRDLSCWVFKWIYLWPTLYRSVCPFPVCEFFKPKCFLQLVISKLQLKHKVTFFNTKYEPNTHWLSQHLYFLLYRVCMLKISKIVRFCEWERLHHKTLGDKEWDDLTPLAGGLRLGVVAAGLLPAVRLLATPGPVEGLQPESTEVRPVTLPTSVHLVSTIACRRLVGASWDQEVFSHSQGWE